MNKVTRHRFRKVGLLLFILIAFHFDLTAQPTITWQNCYGGSYNEGVKKIIRTSDGGYLTVGHTILSADGDVSGNHGSADVWVFKVDSIGNLLWQKCLGGTWSEGGNTAIETVGGYIICASTRSNDGDITFNHGGDDYWVVKLDYSGNLLWQNTYGGSFDEALEGIAQTPDSGFVLCGWSQSVDGDVTGNHGGFDFWIVRIDSAGNLVWQKSLGGSYNEYYGEVQVDSAGNIYGVCVTGSVDGDVTCHQGLPFHGSSWCVKLDSIGNILWQRCFGGTNNDEIKSMELKGSKILMSGASSSSDYDLSQNYGYYDAWILLIDTSGNIILSNSYGGSETDVLYDAKFTPDGKIIAGGWSLSTDIEVTMNHDPYDCWLISVDTTGNLLWQNTYGSNGWEAIGSLISFSNGNIQFAASGGLSNSGDVTGVHDSLMNGHSDIWLANLDMPVEITEIITIKQNGIIVSPNPSITDFIIKFNIEKKEKINLTLYDQLGKEMVRFLKQDELEAGDHNIKINAAQMAAGIYYIKLQTEINIATLKIIKL